MSSQSHHAVGADFWMWIREDPVVRRGQIAIPGIERQKVSKLLPPLGQDPSHRPSDPVDLGVSGYDNTSKQEFGDRAGMCLRVGKAECGPPRSAPNEPPLDLQGDS